MNSELLIIITCVISILVAAILGISIKKIPVVDKKMLEISGYIKNGAMAYLYRQYKVLSIFLATMVLVLCFTPGLGYKLAISFVIGAIFSVCAGYFGMRTAWLSVRPN